MSTLVKTERCRNRTTEAVKIWAFLVLLALMTPALVIGEAFLESSNSEGWSEGYFNQTVKVTSVYSNASWLFPSATSRTINVVLLRTGQYVMYPKATYDVTISVPDSVSPQQRFVLKSGEVDMTFPLEVKWQWTPGSFAQRQETVPDFVNVTIKRRSDGAQQANVLCFCGRGRGPF